MYMNDAGFQPPVCTVRGHPRPGLGGRGSCSRPLHPVGIGNIELNQTWTEKRYVVSPIGGHPRPGLGGCGSCSRLLHPVGIGNMQLNQIWTGYRYVVPHLPLSEAIPALGMVGVAPAPAPFIRWVLAI